MRTREQIKKNIDGFTKDEMVGGNSMNAHLKTSKTHSEMATSTVHCTIFVAGDVYVLDFDQMLQQRRNDPSRKRTMPKLGIAGIHLPVASE